jgi:hypothetical protein
MHFRSPPETHFRSPPETVLADHQFRTVAPIREHQIRRRVRDLRAGKLPPSQGLVNSNSRSGALRLLVVAHSGELDRAVIITVIAMRMMKVAVDQIVDVIAVRHRFVSAARPVHVACIMGTAGVAWRTLVRIFRAHLKFVLVYMIAMRMMQVTVMQVNRRDRHV